MLPQIAWDKTPEKLRYAKRIGNSDVNGVYKTFATR